MRSAVICLLVCLLAVSQSQAAISKLKQLQQLIDNRSQKMPEELAQDLMSRLSQDEVQDLVEKANFNKMRRELGHEEAVSQRGMHTQTYSAPCTNPPLNPNAVLNNNQDIIPPTEYVVTVRGTRVCNFDPHGISADEMYTSFGIRIPYSLVAADGTGRRTCYTDLCPAKRDDVHRLNAQRANLWGIAVSVYAANNISMPYLDMPVTEGRHPLEIWLNGFADFFLEYIRWYDHIVTDQVCVRMVDYHGGDITFNPFADAATIIQQRVNDANFGIQLAIQENESGTGSFFAGHIDESKVIVSGHSYGGLAAVVVGAGSATFGIPRNPYVKFVKAMDPTLSSLPYSDLARFNLPYLGLYSQDALAFQGIIRLRNANQNPINHAFYIKDSVHQQYQINDCALSQVVRQTGDVVNSFGWAFPGDYNARYCVPDECFPGDTATFAPLEDLYNSATFLLKIWNDAFVFDQVVDRLALTAVGVDIIQNAGRVKNNFVYIGPKKVGNCTWDGASTAIQTNRVEAFYHPYSSSGDIYDPYLYPGGPFELLTDCDAPCEYFCVNTTIDGKAAKQIIQPTVEEYETYHS